MKTEFKITKNKVSNALEVIGDLTAQASEQFKKHLQQLLEENTDRVISLKQVKSIDVSSIQLIHSFRLSIASQRKIQIDLPENLELMDLLVRKHPRISRAHFRVFRLPGSKRN
jgi:ABC-type transporter Mla MlaB component